MDVGGRPYTSSTEQPSSAGRGTPLLHKELRLRDLVLMQVLLVTTETCIGIAARQGSTHVLFWIVGILFFFVPLAVVTRYLAQVLPWEGGVYQWAKVGLGPFAGFLAAWNFWIYSIFLTSSLGISIAESLAYAGGPTAEWMAGSAWLITAVNVIVFAFILAVDLRGFRASKWVSHTGTAAMLAVQLTLIALLFVHPHHQAAPQQPFAFAVPPVTLLSVNLLAKISFTWLNGGEQIAVFAGEIKNPASSIGRSLWIAAPVIALLYILSTGSLLSYVPAQNIDLAAPVSQTLGAAFGASPVTQWIASAGVFAIIVLSVAQYTVIVAETSRLPLVAGWDGLLPAWFTRLHPRFRTPTRALWFVVLCCFGLATLSLIGVAQQEAFQLVTTAAQACYGLYYLILFAVPLARGTKLSRPPGAIVRACAVSGFAVTVVAIVLQVVPIIEVRQPWVFGAKVAIALLGANLLGAVLYARASRSRASLDPGAMLA
jgi:amino acid transporter